MKKIYIGKDHNSYVLGVVLADNKDLATAYFIGSDSGMPYEIEEIDLETDFMDSLPLFSIIKAHKIETHVLRGNNIHSVYVCKR